MTATVLSICSNRTCRRQLGARVKYCPFCGQEQPALEAETVRKRVAPSLSDSGSRDRTAVANVPAPKTTAIQQAVAPVVAVPNGPAVQAASSATEAAPQTPRPTAASRGWPAIAGLIAAGIGLILLIWAMAGSSPKGSVTVTAILPNGMYETSGKVLADGQPIGPPNVAIPRPAGSVVIGYAAQGWSVDEQRETVAANVNSTVRLRLRPMPARVRIVTEPAGADLRIDGRSYGRTPADLMVADGRHEISVSLDGYEPKSSTLTFDRGEDRLIDLDLAPVNPPPQTVPTPDYSSPSFSPPAPAPSWVTPPDTSASLCGKLTSYRSIASYGQQGLVGVWSGNWSSRVCGGLIVEGMRSDGRADIVYVFVASSRPGEFRQPADVDGNVLQFVDPDGGHFTFALVGSSLAARFVSSKGSELDTVFTRQ